jgi:hypothetical protein
MNENDKFEKDEIVWHTAFKYKVKYQKSYYKGWHIVQLPNGGFMETQKIEKFNGQDKPVAANLK